MSRPVYIILDGWYYKIIGTILAFVGVFVVIPILTIPQEKSVKEHRQTIESRIEQGDIDYTFGDISEITSYSTSYSQGEKYKGKIISFTCLVGYSSDMLSGSYSGLVVKSEITGKYLAECMLSAPNVKDNIKAAELKKMFNEGDKITVIGEVDSGGYGNLQLFNCKFIKCS